MLKKSADYRRNYWLFLGHCRLHKQKQRNQLMLNGKKQGGLVNCSYETDNLELNCIIKTWILVPFNIIQILRNGLLWLFTDSQHFAFSSSVFAVFKSFIGFSTEWHFKGLSCQIPIFVYPEIWFKIVSSNSTPCEDVLRILSETA